MPPPARLARLAAHLAPPASGSSAANEALDRRGSDADSELRRLFGPAARSEPLASPSGAGRRYSGVDLAPELAPEQVVYLLDAVATHQIVCFGGQDLGGRFTLQHFERLANHWGALVPHPSNYTRDGVLASVRGPTDGIVEWVPFAQRRAASIDAAFPGQLRALAHESPAVLIASNLAKFSSELNKDSSGWEETRRPPRQTQGGGNWHTVSIATACHRATVSGLTHTVAANRTSSTTPCP